MKIFFKETIYYKIEMDEDSPQKDLVLNDIKSGKITSANEVLDTYGDATLDGYGEYCQDTGEQMTLFDNNGFSTIEVIDDDENRIWENGK